MEQWGVCPLQIEHFPSGGKTIWYLLLFDVIDYSISISCLVGGWNSLGVLVVLYSALGTSFALSFPIAITSTPAHLATSTIKCIINKWIFIYEVSELCWVTLDNNICTDKVERLLKLANHGKSSFVLNAKDIDYSFDIHGFKLQLLSCSLYLICGDNNHIQTDFPIK